MRSLCHEHRVLSLQYEEWLRVRGYRESDVGGKIREAEHFFLWLDQVLNLRDMSLVDLRALRAYQTHLSTRDSFWGGKLKPATVYGMMSRVRNLFRWLKQSGRVYVDPSRDLELPIKPRRRLPRVLEVDEMKKLLDVPDAGGVIGSRNLAMLEVIYSTGLRCAEVCGLRLDRVDLKGMRLSVEGKGAKEAVVPFGEKAGRALAHYLVFGRPRLLKDRPDSGLVFLSKSGRALRRNSVQYMVRQCGEQAGLDQSVHPHMLRHSCATHLLRNGADVRVIQRLLRHEDISSTQIYTHVETESLAAAQKKYHPREKLDG